MCNERFTGSADLWTVSLPLDRGPEGNVALWNGAEVILEGYMKMLERGTDGRRDDSWEGALVALTEAYNRCIEERRRAEELLKLHKVWESRRIGGVVEPESPVRGG